MEFTIEFMRSLIIFKQEFEDAKKSSDSARRLDVCEVQNFILFYFRNSYLIFLINVSFVYDF